MSRSLSILLVALFFLSITAYAFHHHNDLYNHSSCIFCKLAKDISSAENTVHTVLAAPDQPVESFARTTYEYDHLLPSPLLKPRAPPA